MQASRVEGSPSTAVAEESWSWSRRRDTTSDGGQTAGFDSSARTAVLQANAPSTTPVTMLSCLAMLHTRRRERAIGIAGLEFLRTCSDSCKHAALRLRRLALGAVSTSGSTRAAGSRATSSSTRTFIAGATLARTYVGRVSRPARLFCASRSR